ncbi:eCIS core domain-containing protein [Halosimplex amylolyticum]|uniref:eCIS core domain-containing protein n=1 Tax=Halosimplex amylolyticum TaxID=3396616 RepID=UPI003F553C73
MLQRDGRSAGPPDVDGELWGETWSLRDGGRPLPESARSFFEPRFGDDFGDVRVHTGPRADELARSVRATAFTVGSDVVFASGQYRPETDDGKRLLAHELTHVVQQRRTQTPAIQRQDETDSEPTEPERGSNTVVSLVIRRATDTVVVGTDDDREYTYRLTRFKEIPPGTYEADGGTNGFAIDPRKPENDLPSKYSNKRDLIRIEKTEDTAPGAPSPGDLTFSDTVHVKVTASESETAGDEGSATAETAGDESTKESKSAEPSEGLETEPVVEPNPLELPGWVPARARKAIQSNEYATISEFEVRDGLYRFPDAGEGPFGDVLVWTAPIGSGYRNVQAFQMFPSDRAYYRPFAEGSDFQLEVFHDTFTEYNQDLWWYVTQGGLSIAQARRRIRENASERLKLVYRAALTLFEAGFGGLGMYSGSSRVSRRGRQKKHTETGTESSGTRGKRGQSKQRSEAGQKASGEREARSAQKKTEGGKSAGRQTPVDELPVVAKFGKSVREDLLDYWKRRLDQATSSSDRSKYRGYIERIENQDRPTPTQSEEEIAYMYSSIGKSKREVSFKHGREATHGAEGSTRPDVLGSKVMIEVKRVKPENKSSLHGKLKKQLADRATEGPAGYRQTMVVDVRGLDISPKRLEEIAEEIVSDVNESLSARSMENLREVSLQDVQFVTW